jgi:hypothetical protein
MAIGGFAFNFQTHDKEENCHEPVVHPMPEI